MRVAALIALALADLGLTLYGFEHGATEAMPLGIAMWAAFGVAGLLALKIGSVTATLLLIRAVPRRTRAYAWTLALGLMCLPVGWNLALLLTVPS